MGNWCTFFFAIGVILVLVSAIAFAFVGLVGFISLLFLALCCLAFSKLCACVDGILKNQKKIIIMLDNLEE